MKPNWMLIAAVVGASAVTIGAFGAHGLPAYLQDAGLEPDTVERRLETFETGVRYHMYAALTLLAIGLADRQDSRRTWAAAGWFMLLGVLIFSGLLYAIAIGPDSLRWLGRIVPIGGLMQIAAWIAIAIGARNSPS